MKLKRILLMSTIFITAANAMQEGETVGLSSQSHFLSSRPEITFYKLNYHRSESLSSDSIHDFFKDSNEMSNIFEIGSVDKYSSDMYEYTDEVDLENLHTNEELLEKIRESSPVSVNLTDRNIGKEEIEQLLPFKDYIYGLSLSSNFLDSNSIGPIGKLSQLRWIDLSNNSFFDEGIDHLLNLENLLHLKITHNNNISSEAISKLSKTKTLKVIDIDHIDFLLSHGDYSIDLSPFSQLEKINLQESSLKKSNFTNVGKIQIID